MKMIILAAGQGTRLRPLTNDVPKCMVKYKDVPIIDYILDTAEQCNINNIAIVGGYKYDILKNYLNVKNINFYKNEKFDTSNMVSSLFCAKDFMDDDLIISYSDIIYKKDILQNLIDTKNDFSVVVDKEWKKLWSIRMENPLSDAETLKIRNNNIIELGKKTNNYNDIEGQYMGLIKISKNIIKQVINYYEGLDRNKEYDEKDFYNMYMTSFLQMIINNLMDIKPIEINRGWIEIDSTEDLKQYNKMGVDYFDLNETIKYSISKQLLQKK